jgi:hypothetical protein
MIINPSAGTRGRSGTDTVALMARPLGYAVGHVYHALLIEDVSARLEIARNVAVLELDRRRVDEDHVPALVEQRRAALIAGDLTGNMMDVVTPV